MAIPFVRMVQDEIRQIVDGFSAERLAAARQSYVVILRGLPGSGKSTFATLLKMYAEGLGLEAQIWSADDYFTTVHGYQFDPHQLTPAHDRCREYYEQALQRGVPVVIIDNTNVEHREWNRCVEMARNRHAICQVNIIGALTAEQLAARSARAIDARVILRRMLLFIRDDPLFAPHYEVTMRGDAFAPQEKTKIHS